MYIPLSSPLQWDSSPTLRCIRPTICSFMDAESLAMSVRCGK